MSAIPPGFGRGGIPVRHRHAGSTNNTNTNTARSTDAHPTRGELPLFHISAQSQSKLRRRRPRRHPSTHRFLSPQQRRQLFLRRILIVFGGSLLLISYYRSDQTGGEADLANGVEDFDDWKRLRTDRRRRRREEKGEERRRRQIIKEKWEQQQQQQDEEAQSNRNGQEQSDRKGQQQRVQEETNGSGGGMKAHDADDATAPRQPTFGSAGWDLPHIHLVNTRFMQSQGHLQTLGWARLYLFRAFCLSTMVHQTTQNFLWIIKTDPNLDDEIRQSMVELLEPYPNYYLVGSERNYLIGHEEGAWRGGVEGADLLQSSTQIYTGDVELLKRAQEYQNERIVLETRLDADDGLTTGYLDYVQRTALEKFGYGMDPADDVDDDEDAAAMEKHGERTRERAKWMYWCSRQNAEWFADPTVDVGVTNAVQHTLLCVTPGITIGFPVGTRYEEVTQFEHTRIIKDIQKDGGCGLSNHTECVDLVTAFPMMAVRSRTPTSAGMMGIRMEERDALEADKRRLLWKLLQSNRHFGISADDVREANRFIHRNIVEIARDNLKGQCTRGHSCKQTSKEQLQRLTELALMHGKGKSIDEPKFVVLEDT